MRKEHTVSEVTDAEGLTDAQFFYGEIMKLQRKCNMLDQKNRELAEELTKAKELIDCLRRTYDKLNHIIFWLKSIRNVNPKATKASIIDTINKYVKAAEICDREYQNGKYFTDCFRIAEKELKNDSTNS